LYFSALLALLAALPASSPAAAVKWQLVPENGSASPAAAPVYTPVPKTDSQSNPQTESVTTAAPRWQRLDDPIASPSSVVRWTTPTPASNPQQVSPQVPKQPLPQLAKRPAVARSVGRSFTYKGTMYPEVGFFIPNAYRQDVAHRVSVAFQFEGKNNVYGRKCGGLSINLNDPDCSDSRWLAEFTPLITGDLSVGINANMAESLIRQDKGANSPLGNEGLGLAWGFQLKSNLNPTLGAAWIGNNLISNDETGPIGTTKVSPNRRVIAADNGQGYAFLISKLFDLGPVFGQKDDPPAVISANVGVGNGFYQASNQVQSTGLNYGPYGPIANLAFSFNQHLSIFAEWAGLFAGVGASLKPFNSIPITATLLYHSWKGQATSYVNGKPFNIQCGTDVDRCKGALNARITYSF
jgi:hypothetical protein